VAARRCRPDLETELEEAERFNDPGRIARARQEAEFLEAELARAVGLHGRSRRAGAASERARVNVTKVLGRTIDKIAAGHPALGQHLAAAVRRGLYCCYAADPRLVLRRCTRRPPPAPPALAPPLPPAVRRGLYRCSAPDPRPVLRWDTCPLRRPAPGGPVR